MIGTVTTPTKGGKAPPGWYLPQIYGTHYFEGTRTARRQHWGTLDSAAIDSLRIEFAHYKGHDMLITLHLPEGQKQFEHTIHPRFSETQQGVLESSVAISSQDTGVYSITFRYDTTTRYIPYLRFTHGSNDVNGIGYEYKLTEKK